MTSKLYFRYSDIYDQTLAQLAGDVFDYEKSAEKYELVNKYIEYWKPFNDIVFEYYKSLGLDFADFWIAYFVEKRKNLMPFSDPLTVVFGNSLEATTAELVHELCHSLFVYYSNEDVWNKVYAKVNKKFGNEDFATRVHIIVIIFTYFGLMKIYEPSKVDELLNLEKEYEGLDKAWKILDSNSEIFNSQDPHEALDKLTA